MDLILLAVPHEHMLTGHICMHDTIIKNFIITASNRHLKRNYNLADADRRQPGIVGNFCLIMDRDEYCIICIITYIHFTAISCSH